MAYEERAYSGATPQREGVNPWAVGFTMFAAVMMIVSGMFQFFQGLAGVINDDFFVLTKAYAFDMDITTWGWVHMVVGAVIAIGGFCLFTGALWARVLAIGLAMLSMLVNFFYIPYYPVWSLLIIAIDIGVIWGLARTSMDTADM